MITTNISRSDIINKTATSKFYYSFIIAYNDKTIIQSHVSPIRHNFWPKTEGDARQKVK